MKNLRLIASLAGLLAFSAIAHADDFTLVGPVSLTGQGFGTVFTILSMNLGGDKDALGTESGAVAPTNATNLGTLGTNFGGCGATGGPNSIDLCGNANNQSQVMKAADLVALGITSSSQFGLLYNVNQQGVDLNTYLHSPTPFTVYFYKADGTVLFSASYAGTDNPFPPAGGPNGQGTDGYLFVLNGGEFASNYADIAYIGMSGTVDNANDGADNWSVVNPGSTTPIPEPATLTLLGTGLIGLGAKLRRRMKKS